jgi:hypothetical protein
VVQEVALPVELEEGVEQELVQAHLKYKLSKLQQKMELRSALNVKLKKRNKSAFSIFILVMMAQVSDQTSGVIVEGKTVTDFLWDQAEKKECTLYAIVDSARNDDIFRYFLTDNVVYQSLFHGKMDMKFFGVSGFLMECKKDSKLFNWLTTEVWCDSCSIFFVSKAPFDEVLRHFQKFNRVYLEDDDVVYFRYYDPRVLRVYLPTCNGKEIKTFFGEIESFYMGSVNPQIVIEYQRYSSLFSDKLTISNHRIT